MRKMESEGPYSTGDSDCLVFLNGRGVESFDSRRDAMNAASLANTAHSDGRKAGEKDLRELLSITEKLYCATDEAFSCPELFAWKKARGIE